MFRRLARSLSRKFAAGDAITDASLATTIKTPTDPH
jgi:hypothetical protein